MNLGLTSRTVGMDKECPTLASTTPEPVRALMHTLEQLANVIRSVNDEQYVADTIGTIAGSIGGHVRHCLDHVSALVTGVDRGFLDYDRRERGTDIEFSRETALQALNRLKDALSDFTLDMLAWPIRVTVLPTSEGPAYECLSSVGREVTFVSSHTVHHNAMIGALVRSLGINVSADFGFAPSTLAYMTRRGRTPTVG